MNLKEVQLDLEKYPNANLIAVSKTKSIESIQLIYNQGQKVFGENKVQELLEKSEALSKFDIKWHFIGHLQSNKINSLLRVRNLVSIHSIDSSKLLNKLLSKKIDKSIGVFLQINTSGEVEKHGFCPHEGKSEIQKCIELIDQHHGFFFQGFMTIGAVRTNDFLEDAKKCFKLLNTLKNELAPKTDLSMGMSQDYKIALDYDSNWVRIGSKIFGERK